MSDTCPHGISDPNLCGHCWNAAILNTIQENTELKQQLDELREAALELISYNKDRIDFIHGRRVKALLEEQADEQR